jgi:hypothetical protein
MVFAPVIDAEQAGIGVVVIGWTTVKADELNRQLKMAETSSCPVQQPHSAQKIPPRAREDPLNPHAPGFQ